MEDILLNYVMGIDVITPTPPASTAWLKDAVVVVKPLAGVESGVTECFTKDEVQALTNAQCFRCLERGMGKIYVATTEDLATLGDMLTESKKQFFTVIIDGTFDDVSTLDLGAFDGVVAWTSQDEEALELFSVSKNNVAFYDLTANESRNMYEAFGYLLSRNTWDNCQYIEMPLPSGIDLLGEADKFFDKKFSFVLTSREYGNRLGLFASNKRAIVAPYIFKEININLQSEALRFITLNRPDYTILNAGLLEDVLQAVIDLAITKGDITYGKMTVVLLEKNFVANAQGVIDEPKALWRINATIQQGI